MIPTKRKIKKMIDEYETLLSWVDDFVREVFPKERRGDVKFEYGFIHEYVNESCHCHPEMRWVQRASAEDFYKWIKDQGDRYYPTHYQKL
jgi:hypothetical protein